MDFDFFQIDKDCLDLNIFITMLHIKILYIKMLYIMLLYNFFFYEISWNILPERQMKGDCKATMLKDIISNFK